MPGIRRRNDKKSESDSKNKTNDDEAKKKIDDDEDALDGEEIEGDLRSFLLKLNKETKQTIDKSEENIKLYIDEKCSALNELVTQNTASINKVQGTVIEVQTLAGENKTEIQKLADRVHYLEVDNQKLVKLAETATKNNDVQAIHIATLQHRIEDQTNRNCRRTLTVKGIKEAPNETWINTKRILADTLNDLCQLEDKERLFRCIERAHRGGKVKNGDKKEGMRDIHVLFFDWNDSQMILSKFLKHGRGRGVFVEQRYGPDTTFRRNKAKEERRNLMNTNVITSGFVQYPAKLMVKYTRDDPKYTMMKDFSHIDVSLQNEARQ